MSTIVTRAGKGSPLTNTEVDTNFTNLNTDKIQSGDTVASLDINGGTIDGTTIGGSTPAVGSFTQVNADNLRLDGNALTSTNTNGNIDLTPNGTGEVNITKVDIDSGTIDNTAIGGATPAAGAFTTLSASSTVTLSGGTANGVAYLNGSKVLTTGSALTFDGTTQNSPVYQATTGAPGFSISNQATGPARSQYVNNGGTFYFGLDSSAGGLSTAYAVNYWYTGNYPHVWALNNAEQMRLTSTGLGIGTSSPASKLHVDAGSLAPTSGSIARFDTTATTAYSGGGFVGGQIRLNYGNATSSYGGINFSNFGATSQEFFGVVQNSSGYGNFVWQGFNGSYGERMRLDSSGNLGLGVTPSAWGGGVFKVLQLGGGGSNISAPSGADEQIQVVSNGYYDGSAYKYVISAHASRYVQNNGVHQWDTAPSGTAGNAITFTQAMTLDASGNLLVGTTSSAANRRLAVSGGHFLNATNNSHLYGNFNESSTKAIWEIRSNTGSSSSIGFVEAGVAERWAVGCKASDSALVFASGSANVTDGTERMRIDSSGNLLVGTTSPISGNECTIYGRNAGTTLACYTPGANYALALLANDTSYVYFGRGTPGSFTQTGSITNNGTNTAYNTSSDYRLKNITGPITNSGAYIDSLNPVEGTWKADGSTFVGLIAHEVQEVSRTQIATGKKDGEEMQGMDYSSAEIIANLIAEVKSLRTRVAGLEAK